MKRKKLSMFIVIIFFIIFVITIGILVVNNKKRNSEFEIQEYIPQEEISYEQLRKTNIFLYYLNKKTGELDSEIRQIDSRELLEKPEKSWCIDGEKYNYTEEEYNIKINDKMPILTPKTRVKKLFKQSIKN